MAEKVFALLLRLTEVDVEAARGAAINAFGLLARLYTYGWAIL